MQRLEESRRILKYMGCKESHLTSWLHIMERKVKDPYKYDVYPENFLILCLGYVIPVDIW